MLQTQAFRVPQRLNLVPFHFPLVIIDPVGFLKHIPLKEFQGKTYSSIISITGSKIIKNAQILLHINTDEPIVRVFINADALTIRAPGIMVGFPKKSYSVTAK